VGLGLGVLVENHEVAMPFSKSIKHLVHSINKVIIAEWPRNLKEEQSVLSLVTPFAFVAQLFQDILQSRVNADSNKGTEVSNYLGDQNSLQI
jgi:hypothetical protein